MDCDARTLPFSQHWAARTHATLAGRSPAFHGAARSALLNRLKRMVAGFGSAP